MLDLRTWAEQTAQLWIISCLTVGVPLVCLTLLEFRFPRDGATSRLSWRTHGKPLVFWGIYNLISILILDALKPLIALLHPQPLLPALGGRFLPRPVALVVDVVLAAMIGDLIYYWYHRFQHRFLWRFHAMHHSLREMNGFSNYHHFSEALMRTLLCGVPTLLLVNDMYAVPIVGTLIAFQGYYLHSSTRLHLGSLGRFVVDNRFHRIHHSLQKEHFDKNFAIVTTLWDRLFRTAWFPKPEEWPETGVADYPEPASVRDYLYAPFVWSPDVAPAQAPASQTLMNRGS